MIRLGHMELDHPSLWRLNAYDRMYSHQRGSDTPSSDADTGGSSKTGRAPQPGQAFRPDPHATNQQGGHMMNSVFCRTGRSIALAVFAVLVTAGSALAQAGRIEGTVTNAITGERLPGAMISVRGTAVTITT